MAYIAVLCHFAVRIGVWDKSLLDETAIWFISVGAGLLWSMGRFRL